MRINKWHRIKQHFRQLFCEHTHTFKLNIPEAHWFDNAGVDKGRHGQLQLRGCYICGKVWVVDYGA